MQAASARLHGVRAVKSFVGMREAIHHPLVPEFICEFHQSVADTEGRRYQARVYGVSQGKKIWSAVIVFFPENDGELRRTSPEFEHDSRQHLADWASAITPAYLELALERSHPFYEAGSHAPEHVQAVHGSAEPLHDA